MKDFVFRNTLRHRILVRVFFVLLVVTITVTAYHFEIFKRLELMTVDYRFKARPPHPQSQDIVFIEMAEDGIESIGSWPWKRKWHATLISILSEYEARTIVFDVIFSEAADEIDDLVFADAIKKSKITYLPLFYNVDDPASGHLYEGKGVISVLDTIRPIKNGLKGTGHINAFPDSDGIFRRIPPIIDYEGERTYQLGFKVGVDMLGLSEEDIHFYPDQHLIVLRQDGGKDIKIPLDATNQLIINWQGKWGETFPHYSYLDIIRSYALIKEGKPPLIDLSIFKNKTCIVGLTATGLIDIKPIPIENAYPAVGVNALILASLISNDYVYDTPKIVNILLMLIVLVAVTLYLFGLRPLDGMLFTLGSIIAYVAISVVTFNVFHRLIVTFYPVFGIAIAYAFTASYVQILHSIERNQLFKQATRDGLTRLYNVRHFNILLENEFKSVSLFKARRLSLIMADVDNFKSINDTYGHQAGDIVLKEVANIIQSKCRQIDITARYGGEEFIVMLVGSGSGWAVGIAEKIREAIEKKEFIFGQKKYSTTISLGIAEYTNEKVKEELIEKTDKALYKSKRDGKNRVSLYESDQ